MHSNCSFAVGDVCMREQFTHVAGECGHMVTRNALGVDEPQQFSTRVVPWCTYTFPEVAHVGKYERDCDPNDVRTFTLQLNHFDRCITDDYDGEAGGRTGFVRIHTRLKTDEILGACSAWEHASDMHRRCALISIRLIFGTVSQAPRWLRRTLVN